MNILETVSEFNFNLYLSLSIYIHIYIYIYIYIYLETVKLNSLTGCQKRDPLLKNKLKQRGMYDVLKYLVFEEHVTVKWRKLSNDKSMVAM